MISKNDCLLLLADIKNKGIDTTEPLKELLNFFTGLITYLFRGLIIGIISIFDRLINNTGLNTF